MIPLVADSKTPISIAVVGGGHWGPHLIRNFLDHPSSDVSWLIEVSLERQKALSSRFPSLRMTAEIEEALEDPGVDAVIIATPTTTHADLVRKALRAEKHVLVEKPLTSDGHAARELCKLAEASALILMVGHVFLFNPAIIEVRRLITGGDIGDVLYASMLRTNLGPVRTDVNAAWDLASHDVSIANFWLGSSPLSVTARGGSWLNDGIDDAVFATMEYRDNVLVHIHASWLNPRKSRFFSVVGSEQMVTVNDMDLLEPLRIYDKGVEKGSEIDDTIHSFRASIREGAVTIPRIAVTEPLRAECDEFLERIRGRGSDLSNGWQGLEVVRALEAIERSAVRRGAEVALTDIP